MTKRKEYNPFKMWGSYFIPTIYVFSVFLFLISGCGSYYEMFNVGGPDCSGASFTFAAFLSIPLWPSLILTGFRLIFAIPLHIITGFLMGWGIHSISRKIFG